MQISYSMKRERKRKFATDQLCFPWTSPLSLHTHTHTNTIADSLSLLIFIQTRTQFLSYGASERPAIARAKHGNRSLACTSPSQPELASGWEAHTSVVDGELPRGERVHCFGTSCQPTVARMRAAPQTMGRGAHSFRHATDAHEDCRVVGPGSLSCKTPTSRVAEIRGAALLGDHVCQTVCEVAAGEVVGEDFLATEAITSGERSVAIGWAVNRGDYSSV